MDSFFLNLYRTRLYLPLALIFVLCVFVPAVRKRISCVAARIDLGKTMSAAVICAAISFLFCIGVIYEGKSWGGDFSQYYAQARAVVTGTIAEWYEKNIFIIDHSCVIGADVYPWMWPLMIAPVYAVFGSFPVMLLKVYEAVIVAAGVFLLVYFLRRRVPLSRAVFLCCFVLWNYVYIMDVNSTEADLVSFFWGMVALNFVDLYLRERNEESLHVRRLLCYSVGSGAAICCAVMTKTLCEGLLLALIAYDVVQLVLYFLHRRGGVADTAMTRAVGKAAIAATPYISYTICSEVFNRLLLPSGGSYKDYFTFSAWRFQTGIRWYYGIFQGFFGSSVRPIISVIVCACGTALLLLTAAGIAVSIIRFHGKLELYYGFYVCGMLLMLLFYDYYRSSFVLTFYPLMLLFAYYAMQWLFTLARRILPGRAAVVFRRVCCGTGMVVLLLTLSQSLTAVYAVQCRNYNMNDIMTEETQETFAYIRDNLDSDDVVYFLKPRVLYLYTDVYSYYWDDDDPARLDLADYVLMSVYNDQPNIQEVLDDPSDYRTVFQNERFTLYRKIKTEESMGELCVARNIK